MKVIKRGREQYLLLLTDALNSPDEIWTHIEWIASLQKICSSTTLYCSISN
ncbi:PBECR2 nuclease fold domain-containing protein [Gilliamella apicola]|uniref:PBECR2 nuclease fold domain-containing protein n=1 Tax=Gilliamella apicola TaxID=1196095 RepID=UPI003FA614D6